MAAKKRSKSTGKKAGKPVRTGRPMPALATALRSVLNMALVVASSGSVLLVLFAAKRLT